MHRILKAHGVALPDQAQDGDQEGEAQSRSAGEEGYLDRLARLAEGALRAGEWGVQQLRSAAQQLLPGSEQGKGRPEDEMEIAGSDKITKAPDEEKGEGDNGESR